MQMVNDECRLVNVEVRVIAATMVMNRGDALVAAAGIAHSPSQN